MFQDRNDSSIQRQRSLKHHKLIRYIENYRRTTEQVKKLARIKDNTVMEINLRFLRSEPNRKYKFPKMEDSDGQSSVEFPNFPNPSSRDNQLYNLNSQNEIQKGKTIVSRVISLDTSEKKRVRSLEKEKGSLEKQRICRLNLKKRQHSVKKLRKNSIFQDNHHRSNIKLPEINNHLPKNENCQTEGPDYEVNQVIGKKLLTEASSVKKLKGVQRYVREMKERNKDHLQSSEKRVNKFVTRQWF